MIAAVVWGSTHMIKLSRNLFIYNKYEKVINCGDFSISFRFFALLSIIFVRWIEPWSLLQNSPTFANIAKTLYSCNNSIAPKTGQYWVSQTLIEHGRKDRLRSFLLSSFESCDLVHLFLFTVDPASGRCEPHFFTFIQDGANNGSSSNFQLD